MAIIRIVDLLGKMDMSLEGTTEDLAKTLITAMCQDRELAAVVLSAIPSYLDVTGRSRNKYCEMIKQGRGATPDEVKQATEYIISSGGKIV